ncbi:MAG: multicopper oxidase domain-containing protein, partial [Gemmatimonadaceae bacterium]
MTSIDRKPESTTLSRRDMMRQGAAAIAGGALAMGARPVLAQATPADLEPPALPPPLPDARRMPPGRPGVDYTPVVTPNGTTLPFRLVNDVKVFHLTAETFTHEFAPGLRVTCWGYNGRTPGPIIEAVEGDRVRIYVTNKLPEPTSVHWHGVLLPAGMDGVAGLSQSPI